ncbi:MAG: hypothetical protein WBM50_02005 [Acidimicrobiales bacterium]
MNAPGLSESRPAGARSRLRSDRGEIPTILVVFAATVLAFYGAVHAALVFHAKSVVSAAAQDGLRAAQIEDGTEADGRAAAEQTLSLASGLRNKAIAVSQSDDQVRVTVSAEIETPLIELFNSVSADVTGPRERFYSEAERR